MDQTRFLQRVRMNQFERVYRRWKEKKVTQAEAAEQLGMGKRTFRRYTVRYSNQGVGGLLDKRLGALSHNRPSQKETPEVVELYKALYPERNVAHFYEAYKERHGPSLLQLGKKDSLLCGSGEEAQGRGSAPGAQAAAGAGRGDDTPGRKHAQVGSPRGMGPCGDHGRRHW